MTAFTTHTHPHNHLTALLPGPPGWTSARRELLDFMVQGKINRGRHTDHPAGCHSIQTKQHSTEQIWFPLNLQLQLVSPYMGLYYYYWFTAI